MSKKLEALKKQQAEIAAAIEREEMIAKSRNRIERITLKVLGKHPQLFTINPANFEKELDEALAKIAGNV